MESLLYHNTLVAVEEMGFQVTWKFISIGLHGKKNMSCQISYEEMFEYFDILLNGENDRIEDIIALLCVRENVFEVDSVLHELEEREQQDAAFELRKWRIYLLKKILDNKKEDVLQGLLELIEFWLPIKDEVECPHIFPTHESNDYSVQKYFTETMYDYLLHKNRKWLEKEIEEVIRVEKKGENI